MTAKAKIFFPLAIAWFIGDFFTKSWVTTFLGQHNGSYRVVGDYLRLTLSHNTGMAFGFSFGDASRPILIAFTFLTLLLIVHLYRETRDDQKFQTIALALVLGGALGNLLDRFRSATGVADFIDVGIGTHRFWIFNMADAGISIGGVMLAITLWFSRKEETPAKETPSNSNESASGP